MWISIRTQVFGYKTNLTIFGYVINSVTRQNSWSSICSNFPRPIVGCYTYVFMKTISNSMFTKILSRNFGW